MTAFRRAFVAASVAWAALLPVAPFAAAHSTPAPLWYGLAFAVYAAGSVVCHQLPARSFQLWAAQLPVCARCTGIYVGGAIAAVLATVRPTLGRMFASTRVPPFRRDDAWRARTLIALSVLPTVATLVSEWTTGHTPSNAIRALAGAPLGAAVAFIVVNACRAASDFART